MVFQGEDNEWDDNVYPIAYLITFRTYGTWLHGDQRTSTKRKRTSRTGTKLILPNVPLEDAMREEMDQPVLVPSETQRKAITEAAEDLCKARDYRLYALNVRSNHVHCVIGVSAKPERVADSLKAFATKRLRELRLVDNDRKVWSRGRSRRYLWKDRHVAAAIDYVLYCQSDIPFELE